MLCGRSLDWSCTRIRNLAKVNVWTEYDSAAEWCAKRGIKGTEGDSLPDLMSGACCELISADPDAFQRRVKDMAYGLAMEKLNLPEE